MEITIKQRTPSQCREWERQRRNKFNDSISKLGEIVECNAKYSKVEIIQKAIRCLTNNAIEKTQLKAEILALKVKLDMLKERKDASTQVYMGIKKTKSGKVKKNKKKIIPNASLKVKCVYPTKPDITKNENKPLVNEKESISTKPKAPVPKLPTLLPRYNAFDKKVLGNIFVVLPATPYNFPQRPFLLPSMPPAIVVEDHNLQAVNNAVPFASRNGGDITKTTIIAPSINTTPRSPAPQACRRSTRIRMRRREASGA